MAMATLAKRTLGEADPEDEQEQEEEERAEDHAGDEGDEQGVAGVYQFPQAQFVPRGGDLQRDLVAEVGEFLGHGGDGVAGEVGGDLVGAARQDHREGHPDSGDVGVVGREQEPGDPEVVRTSETMSHARQPAPP